MLMQLTPQFGAILLTIVIATVVSVGTHSVDIVNRVLFSVKIIVLVLTLSLLVPHVQSINLLEIKISLRSLGMLILTSLLRPPPFMNFLECS